MTCQSLLPLALIVWLLPLVAVMPFLVRPLNDFTIGNHWGVPSSFGMFAIVTGRPYTIYGNLPNTGQIPQLPPGAVVETPCLADANGARPTVVTDIPPQLIALMRSQINVQELTVRALLDEDPAHIYHAAMMDPHTAAELDLPQIRALIDDLRAANGDWLPPWARLRKAA